MDNKKYFSIKNNNLNLISLFFAIAVIYSHSYPLSLGSGNFDILGYVTKQQVDFGSLAVNVLFIISGFLIANSYARSKTNVDYVKARLLRIIPGLFVAVIFSALVVGLIATTLTNSEYLLNSQTYGYITKMISFGFLPGANDLPGVFMTNNYSASVNGSLWTLRPQMILYLLLMIAGIIGILKKRKVVLTGWIFIFFIYVVGQFIDLPLMNYIRLANYFALGVVFYTYHDKINYTNSKWFLSIIAGLVISAIFGFGFNILFGCLGAYVIFYLAFKKKILPKFDKLPDISYGVYIYAFPIQQLLTHLFNNNIQPMTNFVISTVIVVILATLSWYLVEKPALKLKNFSFKSDKQENVLNT